MSSGSPACAEGYSARNLKIWTNSLVLPARLIGAAAENCAHRYIGKVCCLSLVRADSEYFWPPPRPGPKRRGPEGTGIAQAQAVTRHRPISKLKLKVESHIHGGGRTDTKGQRCSGRGENWESRREARAGGDVGCREATAWGKSAGGQEGDGGRRRDNSIRGVEWQKQREGRGRFISCSRQLVAGGHQAGLDVLCAKNPRYLVIGQFSHCRRMLTGKSANQQQTLLISNCRAGLEVLSEREVWWKESSQPEEAQQEVTGASVIKVLLLPEMGRDELAYNLNKSLCFTRVAERHRSRDSELRPSSLYWKCLLFITQESWLYWAAPFLLKLLWWQITTIN